VRAIGPAAACALEAGLGIPGVRAFTTLRRGAGGSLPPYDSFDLGARNGDDPATVAANRRELESRLGLPSPPQWLRQVHGTAVLVFDSPRQAPLPVEQEPEADAAVTSTAGVCLAVLTADCMPVVLAAADGSAVGVAHAGWRGLSGGVLEATVAAMPAPATGLRAWLGPAAGPQAYEVGEEVRAAFVDQAPGDAAAFVATRPGHWRVDLYALARRRLGDAGLDPAAISGGGHCTILQAQDFYSHRRDQVSGRMATVAWLSPPA
jgi:YfiH family protein